jgi:hypothetical protein
MTHIMFPPNLEKIRREMWKRIAGHTHTHTEILQFIVRHSKIIEDNALGIVLCLYIK